MVTTSQNPSGLGLFRDLLTAVHLSLNPQRCQFPVHFIPRRRRRREHRRNGEPSSLSLSETMPDLREPIAGGGYWIRRVDYSPTTVAAQGKARRFFPTNNKENIPCGWRKSPAARFRRPGRSPLPDWYPRTPLRDITSIVKAYEKRRLRIQAAQTAATSSSAAPDLQITNPQPQESSSTASQRSMKLPIKACPAITTEPPLQTDESPQTPAPLTDHADDGQTAVTESTLLNSIEQIEKAVKKNMIKMKKPENKRATQLRNLMSMR